MRQCSQPECLWERGEKGSQLLGFDQSRAQGGKNNMAPESDWSVFKSRPCPFLTTSLTLDHFLIVRLGPIRIMLMAHPAWGGVC